MERGNTTILVLIVAIAIVTAGAFYLNKHDTYFINQNPQTTPTPSPAPKFTETGDKIFKSSYYSEPDKGRFSLRIPENCQVDDSLNNPAIKCPTFKIYPQAGGYGAEVISKTEVVLNDKTWDKVIFKPEQFPGKGAAYGLTVDNTYQLIEVHYDNYSTEVEKTAEKIISTFKPL